MEKLNRDSAAQLWTLRNGNPDSFDFIAVCSSLQFYFLHLILHFDSASLQAAAFFPNQRATWEKTNLGSSGMRIPKAASIQLEKSNKQHAKITKATLKAIAISWSILWGAHVCLFWVPASNVDPVIHDWASIHKTITAGRRLWERPDYRGQATQKGRIGDPIVVETEVRPLSVVSPRVRSQYVIPVHEKSYKGIRETINPVRWMVLWKMVVQSSLSFCSALCSKMNGKFSFTSFRHECQAQKWPKDPHTVLSDWFFLVDIKDRGGMTLAMVKANRAPKGPPRTWWNDEGQFRGKTRSIFIHKCGDWINGRIEDFPTRAVHAVNTEGSGFTFPRFQEDKLLLGPGVSPNSWENFFGFRTRASEQLCIQTWSNEVVLSSFSLSRYNERFRCRITVLFLQIGERNQVEDT